MSEKVNLANKAATPGKEQMTEPEMPEVKEVDDSEEENEELAMNMNKMCVLDENLLS